MQSSFPLFGKWSEPDTVARVIGSGMYSDIAAGVDAAFAPRRKLGVAEAAQALYPVGPVEGHIRARRQAEVSAIAAAISAGGCGVAPRIVEHGGGLGYVLAARECLTGSCGRRRCTAAGASGVGDPGHRVWTN